MNMGSSPILQDDAPKSEPKSELVILDDVWQPFIDKHPLNMMWFGLKDHIVEQPQTPNERRYSVIYHGMSPVSYDSFLPTARDLQFADMYVPAVFWLRKDRSPADYLKQLHKKSPVLEVFAVQQRGSDHPQFYRILDIPGGNLIDRVEQVNHVAEAALVERLGKSLSDGLADGRRYLTDRFG
jgi:hypothetical protein